MKQLLGPQYIEELDSEFMKSKVNVDVTCNNCAKEVHSFHYISEEEPFLIFAHMVHSRIY
jgi:hypothetical protein